MVCLFCLKDTNDGVTMYGTSEFAEHARNIIEKHFWFDVSWLKFHVCSTHLFTSNILRSQINEINLTDTYACSNCWSKVESFHEFYIIVQTNYNKNFRHNDVKIFVNPLLDCEPETIIDEGTIKIETQQYDSAVTNYATVFVPSTSYWDESNKQIDSFTNEKNSLETEPSTGNSNAMLFVKEELVSIGRACKRKRESNTTSTKSTLRQRKKPTKTKLKVKKMKTTKDKRKSDRKNARIVEEVV